MAWVASAAALSGALAMGCQSGPTFQKLQQPHVLEAGIYIYRPENPVLSLWDFEVQLADPKAPKVAPARKLSLGNGEYAFWRLPPGSYQWRVAGFAGTEHTFHAEKGEVRFFRVYLFTKGRFSGGDALVQEVEPAVAVREFLDPYRLTRHRSSVD